MDAIDVLTMAIDVARMIRSTAAPDATLRAAFELIGKPVGDETEPMSVRVTRLVQGADHLRGELNEWLRTQRGPLYLNRPLANGAGPHAGGPDPETRALIEYVESEEAERTGIDLFGEHFCPYKIGSREIVSYIDLEDRDGVEQPKVVRGLIDYPIHQAVSFSIDLKSDMWYLWDILAAFSDQYDRIYERAEEFGVWGHDLDDLWIDRLIYYPQRQLIYPFISS